MLPAVCRLLLLALLTHGVELVASPASPAWDCDVRRAGNAMFIGVQRGGSKRLLGSFSLSQIKLCFSGAVSDVGLPFLLDWHTLRHAAPSHDHLYNKFPLQEI